MLFRAFLTMMAVIASAGTVHAQDSAIILGKSTFGARCAVCHGNDADGGGEIAALFQVPPSDLTGLTERAGGSFPFSEVYQIIKNGMEAGGHGDSEMPVWGDYFLSDSLEDRGVSKEDALHITQGRILSLVYYLESIQQ